MRLFKTNPERLPMVWFLLGLLFNAAGLFLGYEFSVAFGYIIVGLLCCAFGIVLFVLQLMEPRKKSAKTRLSFSYSLFCQGPFVAPSSFRNEPSSLNSSTRLLPLRQARPIFR